MKKTAFVIPGFFADDSFAAMAKSLIAQLNSRGMDIDVLTISDNENMQEGNIPIKCFARSGGSEVAFNKIKAKLNSGKKFTVEDESVYINENENSYDLYDYIREHKNDYSMFVFMRYNASSTYFGAAEVCEKAAIIPCFDNAPEAQFHLYKHMYEKVSSMVFFTEAEAAFANENYDLLAVKTCIAGLGVTQSKINSDDFCKKHGITAPFVVCDCDENADAVQTMLTNFAAYKSQPNAELELVLLNAKNIEINENISSCTKLINIPENEKAAAFAASYVVCHPSQNGSCALDVFSALNVGRPVLVNGDNFTAKELAVSSCGGLYYADISEFVAALKRLTTDKPLANTLGSNGSEYIKQNCLWTDIAPKYVYFFVNAT